MAEVGSAFLTIIPSARGFRGQLEAQTSPGAAAAGRTAGAKFGGGMSSSLKAIGIATVAATAAGFIKGAVGEAREAQKVGAVTAQVIKTTGSAANVTAKQVGALSNAISKKTGVDDEAVQSGANLLLTFTNVQNQAGKGNDIFNQATAAVQDMAVAFHQDAGGAAKQLGKALNDPVKGVTALTRVGIQFSAQQKAQIKTLVKSGNVLGAQKIILAEIAKESGGAAAAQATAGDKMRVSWANFQEAVGTLLLPVMDKLFAGLTKVINFITAHQSVMIVLGVIVGTLLVAAFVAATAAVWSFTIALLANPITWIVVLIVAFIAVIVLLVVGIVKLVKAIVRNWDTIKKKTGVVWDWIKEKVSAVWSAIVTWISKKWDQIKATVTTKGAAVLKWFKDLPGKLLGLLVKADMWLIGIGENIMRGIIRGIGNGFTWVKDKIKELGGNVIQWAREILHIGSPSKLMADEVGRWIPAGIALGIDRNAGDVRASLAALTSDLSLNARLSARTGRGMANAAASDRPRDLYLRSGELKLVNGKAYISGIISEQAFAAGLSA